MQKQPANTVRIDGPRRHSTHAGTHNPPMHVASTTDDDRFGREFRNSPQIICATNPLRKLATSRRNAASAASEIHESDCGRSAGQNILTSATVTATPKITGIHTEERVGAASFKGFESPFVGTSCQFRCSMGVSSGT